MRLIDAENFCKEHQDFPAVVYVALSKSPTIDPIHAAGGCYCQECKKFRRYTKNNITFGICKRHNSEVRENDFCSYNDGKDGAKQKEAGTDVHQQDD